MRNRYITLLVVMPIILATLYQSRTALLRTWNTSPFASRLAWTASIRSSNKMSTFQHPDYHIPITLPTGLSQSQLLAFPPFNVSLP